MAHGPHDVARNLRGRGTALLLVDWINDFDFEGSDELVRAAEPAARRTALLRDRATAAGLPVLYVNDNFGHWRSDFQDVIAKCRRTRGREIVELLLPRAGDFFVLKPKHSGFLHTPLELLLDHLDIGTLVITGLAGNICVLFTAHDAHMRDFRVVVPCDCVASNTTRDNDFALEQLRRVVHADVRDSDDLVMRPGGLVTHPERARGA
jgi:nicotinamidase-related amidase